MNLFAVLAPFALLFAAPQPTVLVDQAFTLHASAEEAAEAMGVYSMHAQEEAGQIKITESVQLATRRGVVDMTSIVVYKQDGDKQWDFHGASASTGVAGDIVMQVSVLPNEQEWTVQTTFLRDTQGEVFDEPKTTKRTIEVPKGPVLFSSARAIMGPRLQPKAGELPVVWVEFPDDIDEPINIKEGFSLVRDEPDEKGGFMLWVRSENQTLGPLPITADGKVKPHKLWGKMLMREE